MTLPIRPREKECEGIFVGICGSICSGKSEIASYLVKQHGFKRLRIIADKDSAHPATPKNTTDTQPSFKAFSSPEDLLTYVTKRWRERWVTTDMRTARAFDLFSRRPFFILLEVEAPVLTRWERYRASRDADEKAGPRDVDLASFCSLSDAQLYAPSSLALAARASVRVLNPTTALGPLHATLASADLLSPSRLRPPWDAYFMSLAGLAAQRANCMKRRVGCVLVRDRRVLSTGYNGTPRGLVNCGGGGCPRCNRADGSGAALSTCLCLHAEENALLEAGRERVGDGAVLYCDTCPCLTCSIKIAQVGIAEVVYNQGYSMDAEAAAVFEEAGVRLRQFVPALNGVWHPDRIEHFC